MDVRPPPSCKELYPLSNATLRTSARLASKSTSLVPQKMSPEIEAVESDNDTYFSELDASIEIDDKDEYIPLTNNKKTQISIHYRTQRKYCYQKNSKCVKKYDFSFLPAELLQWIFKYTEPKTLGKLVRVCKQFNQIL